MRTELSAARRRLEPLAGKRLLCAVSGGLDSMCLLHFVSQWAQKSGTAVQAAHFNHQLRGPQADRDEAFVRETCARWGIPFTVGRGDVRRFAEKHGNSVEEAARILRYRFLRETAEKEHCPVILTAHHADDNAETILFNLIRGSGVRGLAGIPPDRDGIVRIFLDTPRAELEAYAAEQGLDHVEDETNFQLDAASRNRLRLQVLPLLQAINPRAVEHINAAAAQLRELDDCLEQEADRLASVFERTETGIQAELSSLQAIPPPVRSRLLLRTFTWLSVGRKDVGAVHLETLTALIQRGSGQLDLPHGVTAWCEGGTLYLEKKKKPLETVPMVPGQPLQWGDYTICLLDAPAGAGISLASGGPVEVGPCPPSGRLHLPDTPGPRSVKRLAVDRRIPPQRRDRLPAFYIKHHLAAVWEVGVDRAFLPEESSSQFIQILKNMEENNDEE